MEKINFIELLWDWMPFVLTLIFFILVLSTLKVTVFSRKRFMFLDDRPLIYGLVILSFIVVFTVSIILSLPIGESTKGQLLSLVGIIFAASISLSSTSFLGNVMAGLMLKVVQSFSAGDFIETDAYFGKVSELRLLHTEIQTESRDLLTIPNLYLVTKPVKVVRHSGTIISAEVSLGYEVARDRVEKILCKAALTAGFKDPFVQIISLGDFSVGYKLCGGLENIKLLVSAKSKLRASMLDGLHRAQIEIVSPTFMNQRQVSDQSFIAKVQAVPSEVEKESSSPEKLMFDKADLAESNEKLKDRLAKIDDEIKELKKHKCENEEEEKNQITKIEGLERSSVFLTDLLTKRKEDS